MVEKKLGNANLGEGSLDVPWFHVTYNDTEQSWFSCESVHNTIHGGFNSGNRKLRLTSSQSFRGFAVKSTNNDTDLATTALSN